MRHKSFGDVLKQARREIGLSQRNLALDAGVSVPHVGAIECGRKRPSPATIKKLARILPCSEDKLMLAADYPPSDVAATMRSFPDLLDVIRSVSISLEPFDIAVKKRPSKGYRWKPVRNIPTAIKMKAWLFLASGSDYVEFEHDGVIFRCEPTAKVTER